MAPSNINLIPGSNLSSPIINSLVTKEFSNFRVPVMIVPGNFSKDHIALIT